MLRCTHVSDAAEEPLSAERRDLCARAHRDELARILELQPARLGQLPVEVLEAMRHELDAVQRRTGEQARAASDRILESITDITPLVAGDAEAEELVSELLTTAVHLARRVREQGRPGR